MSMLMIVWILLCVLCFAAGLVWSWRRARRRVEQVVDEEVRQQVAREVLRHLQDGPAHSNGKGES